ncbi:uncharacterized protein VTP21DRAFT_2663 [Calcarisporiella thermophila]|uniref:uncharacterized protein n=1 Tax=Calcarisporiella thermophila TaxID=911321 RepID=UPI003743E5EC
MLGAEVPSNREGKELPTTATSLRDHGLHAAPPQSFQAGIDADALLTTNPRSSPRTSRDAEGLPIPHISGPPRQVHIAPRRPAYHTPDTSDLPHYSSANSPALDLAPPRLSDNAPPPQTHQQSQRYSQAYRPSDAIRRGHEDRAEHYHSSQPVRPRSRKVVGQYTLAKTLGAGSMGKVKLGIHNITGEKVAVKIIPRGRAQSDGRRSSEKDESDEARVVREAAITRLLHHPYIVELHEVFVHTYHHYMIFELVNGGQLLDYIISHGRLKEKQARKFARQIASALDYCHRNSIVHRDLKIENILISQTGDIKIIDFGLSNIYSPTSQLSTFCGSLYFAAPELLNAKLYTGPEVDVWSFGIVLYVLVCGKVPFDDQSMPALHAKIKRGLVEYPNWLSNDCKNLLSRMLVTNPIQRATLAEVMQHPWMNKGFDSPIDSHMPYRAPITLPLDPEVITGMSGFGLGAEHDIQRRLESITQNESYQRAARQLAQGLAYRRRVSAEVQRKIGSSTTSSLTKFSWKPASHIAPPPPPDDPASLPDAYHPLVSIYHLVQEKLERERLPEQRASTSTVNSIPFAEYPSAAQGTPGMGRDGANKPTPLGKWDGLVSIPTPNLHEDVRKSEAIAAAEAALSGERPALSERQAPRSEKRTTNKSAYADALFANKMLRRLSKTFARSRHSLDNSGIEATSPPELSKHTRHFSLSLRKPAANRGVVGNDHASPPSKRFSLLASPENTPALSDKSTRRHTLLLPFSLRGKPFQFLETGSPDQAEDGEGDRPGARSKSKRLSNIGNSIRKLGNKIAHPRSFVPAKEAPGLHRSSTTTSRKTPLSALKRRHRRTLSTASAPAPTNLRASPLSIGEEGDDIGSNVEAGERTPSPPEENEEVEGGSWNEDQRQQLERHVSRSSASSSPQHHHHPPPASGSGSPEVRTVYLKGLFSVATTSTRPPNEIRETLVGVLNRLGIEFRESDGGLECIHAPSVDLSRLDHLHKGSRGSSVWSGNQPTHPVPQADTPPSFSNSDSGVVRFEVFVVRVPWLLGMHGVQFRRVGGPIWQYKNVCSRILTELKL